MKHICTCGHIVAVPLLVFVTLSSLIKANLLPCTQTNIPGQLMQTRGVTQQMTISLSSKLKTIYRYKSSVPHTVLWISMYRFWPHTSTLLLRGGRYKWKCLLKSSLCLFWSRVIWAGEQWNKINICLNLGTVLPLHFRKHLINE